MFGKNPSLFVNDKKLRKKQRKKEYDILFRKGCKLCFFLYFLTILFFVVWAIGQYREEAFIKNSDAFSRIFFFLNPKLFNYVFLKGNALDLLQGASNANSFVFMACYIISFITFFIIICCALWLFLISYRISVRAFHIISCLSMFPIVACFFLNVFIFQLIVYKRDVRLKRISRFRRNFSPEKFEDVAPQLDPVYLESRNITDPFTYKNYKTYFKKEIKEDFLESLYKKLDDFLS